MGDDHVDARLGVRVDEPGEEGRDGRVEAADLDLHVDLRPPRLLRRQAADVDLQVAVAAPATRRHEQPVLDPPAHDAAVSGRLVLGRVEAQQHERAGEEHDVAIGLRVGDPDQPEGDAREVLPVGAREPLEVHRAPHAVQLLGGEREDCRLDRAHGAALVHHRVLLGVADDGVGDVPLAAPVEQLGHGLDDKGRATPRS